jgi:Mu-like prophage I protein
MYDPEDLSKEPILPNFSVGPGSTKAMPYIVEKDTNACPVSKPWAVKNQVTGDVRGRCHASKEEAQSQQRALYAALAGKEGMHTEHFIIPLQKLFSDGIPDANQIVWVQAFPYDTWDHPIYGETTVTPEIAQKYVRNFKENVRGHDLAINFNHGEDKAKGDKAAGWIRDMAARPDGLFFGVEFTPTAREEIKNGEWRYFSTESYDTWEHPHSKAQYEYVISGGALTNKPWVKGMLPINFSEVADAMTEEEQQEAEKQFAVWSTAYVNNLPDSSFLYIEPGGKKDSEGKTVPRTLRHLPVRDASGKTDEAHVRNAIARAPQLVGIPDNIKARLQAAAKRLLATYSEISNMSAFEVAKLSEAQALLDAHGLVVTVNESKEWEHSEPGTGPAPVQIDPEKDAETGSRRPDLPAGFPDTEKQIENAFTTSEDSSLKQLAETIVSLRDEPDEERKQWVAKARETLNFDNADTKLYSEIADLFASVPVAGKLDPPPPSVTPLPPVTPAPVPPVPPVQTTITPEGGNSVDENAERQLRQMFDVDVNGDLVEAAKLKFGELDSLKKAIAKSDQERHFADQYPQLWEEHNALMERDRKNAAKNFSESVSKIRKSEGVGLKETRQGLSARAIEEIRDTHMKFSEGKATTDDFENCIKTIVNGGILEFAERGSSNGEDPLPEVDNTTATGVADARKLFSELTSKAMDEQSEEVKKLSHNERLMKAMEEVSRKHPDLAETYRVTLPA